MKEKEKEIVSLVKADELSIKFAVFKGKIAFYNEASKLVKVEDAQTLKIAENNLRDLQQLTSNLELVRKSYGSPYFETVKEINNYSNTIKSSLDTAKLRFKSVIGDYKRIQEALAREAAKKEREKIEKEIQDKEEEANNISRIEKMLYAMMYGGIFYDKNGEKQSSLGCSSTESCDKLKDLIYKKYPSPEKFVYFEKKSEETRRIIEQKLAEHKINMLDLQSRNELVRTEAMEKISQAKIDAEIEVEESESINQRKIEREAKAQKNKIEKSIKQESKGIRKVIKMKIYDSSLLPREYLTANEDKIKAFMYANNEKIRQEIASGKLLPESEIPGVKFYIEDTFVAH